MHTNFKPSWKKTYDWLAYDEIKNKCIARRESSITASQKNSFFTQASCLCIQIFQIWIRDLINLIIKHMKNDYRQLMKK